MSNSYNFNITQGNSFIVYLNAMNSDGTSINLSGYSGRGYVKNQYSDNTYIYNLNPSPFGPLESGIIAISGAPIDTSLLPVGEFIYNVEIYNPFNSITILEGNFDINPSTSIASPSGGFMHSGEGLGIVINNYYTISGQTYSSILTNLNINLTGYTNYILTGDSSAVWTLPLISNNINANYFIKNRGTGTITLNTTASDMMYSSSPISSFIINSGEAYILSDDSVYWNIS